MKKSVLTMYSLIHFLVDFSCVCILLNVLYDSVGSRWNSILILLYNFLAFGMELPFGIALDQFHSELRIASMGCFSIAAGVVLHAMPWISVVLLGLGNAMFHIGCGTDVLRKSRENAKNAGIFISTGAMGLYFGRMVAAQTGIYLCFLLMMFSGVYLFIESRKHEWVISSYHAYRGNVLLVIFPMMIAILIRSYLGMVVNGNWKLSGIGGFLLATGIVLGKMTGGILADRLGILKVGIISLFLSMIFFWLSFQCYWFSIPASFCFNLSMPVTLYVLGHGLVGNEGYAFGILTLSLFVGALISFLFGTEILSSVSGFSVMILISVLMFVIAWKECMK